MKVRRVGLRIALVFVVSGAGLEIGTPILDRLREAGKRLAARGIAFLDLTAVFRDHPEVASAVPSRLGSRGLSILAEAAARALPVR